MKTTIFAITVFFLIILLTAFTSVKDDDYKLAKQQYEEFCAGCHGYELEEFVSREWIYGKDPESVFHTIKYGQEDIGMPSFDAAFTDNEMRKLTNYLLAKGDINEYENLNKKDKEVIQSEKMKFTIDTIVSGLDIPWGMTWLPDGDMLITERSGILYRLKNDDLIKIKGVPEVYQFGQGGLLDIELHPEYEENGWIYISYSYYAGEDIDDGGSTALMRAKLKNNTLVEQEVLFQAVPAEKRGAHYGSRIEFDRDGYLFLSMGDRGRQDNAQVITNYSGALHRLNDDGSIPEDNPFLDVSGAVPSIYNYGHRNIQGLALHPETGELWSHEHGPKGGDELNIEEPGKNYGWPEITYGINYNGTIITEDTAKEGMEQPVTYWDPSIAPCGMDFVTGDKYPEWKGNILIGSLRFKYVARCVLDGNKVVHEERLLEGMGRVRNVKTGPDGYIYVALETPGIILKIVPVDA